MAEFENPADDMDMGAGGGGMDFGGGGGMDFGGDGGYSDDDYDDDGDYEDDFELADAASEAQPFDVRKDGSLLKVTDEKGTGWDKPKDLASVKISFGLVKYTPAEPRPPRRSASRRRRRSRSTRTRRRTRSSRSACAR